MSGHLVWRVFCEAEGCKWIRNGCESREKAVRWGRQHAEECRHVEDEWRFRVQGVRVSTAPRAPGWTIGDKTYAPHEWEPSTTSRNPSLPCGICKVYRYVHDDIYEWVTLSKHPAGSSTP